MSDIYNAKLNSFAQFKKNIAINPPVRRAGWKIVGKGGGGDGQVQKKITRHPDE